MFSFPKPDTSASSQPVVEEAPSRPKFKNAYQSTPFDGGETTFSALEEMLEQEKQQNKTEAWNKIDKTMKIQKLHAYAEKYGKEHGFPVKDIKTLKGFFVDALDKGKLQRTKDVLYSKDTREISAIPALHFNKDAHAFTLKNMDTKRVSTLKSLTPKIRRPDANTKEGPEQEPEP
jgi:hypothetical protein